MDILRRVMHVGDLHSKDIFSVASTCRPLQRCAPMAYNAIHFPLDATCGTVRGLLRLTNKLTLLLQTLGENRGHPTHIFRITLFAPRSSSADVSLSLGPAFDASPVREENAEVYLRLIFEFDCCLSQLVAHQTTPNLRTFILDASATGLLLPLSYTLMAFLRDERRLFKELGLVRVCTNSDTNMPSPLTDDMPIVPARNLQVRRITVRSEDVQLSRAFLLHPVCVRALDFRESVVSSEPWLAVFGGGLRDAGASSVVNQLCLTCGGSNPLYEDHSDFVSYALTTGWNNLSSLSISAFFKLEHLTELGQCPLRRLRLTVNVDDQFMPEFGPHLLSGILNIFPNLEEIIMDHMRATLYAYSLTEECLVEWSKTIRETSLRVLALSTLFVVEPSDCGSDYADVGTVCSDVEMSDSMESSLNMSDNQSSKQIAVESPEYFLDDLATFSEDFFDKHLRSESLQELRFLYEDPETGYTESVGFRPQIANPSAMEGPEKRDYIAIPVDAAYDMFWEPGGGGGRVTI
ncbi:uncharacterized protein B0H18DRAFT_522738 [Fomitopsis serialis]|uniref:uncharacterized protein n=1 Tax=Fomitopsis serialis TaxID=139415 RepID=UPI002008664D|nr:uncharacterized protein B0H18DRAFT_522738 [Neoantrodia serialis]KAH9922215.1 hypothetical protein B0H18DRAFT_522738 [Neoantrodia serialis]